MGNIWQPPAGGFVTGPGVICIGSLNTDPDHPWGRTNAWAYDGAIYGYREIGEWSDIQYSVLGGQLTVCNFDTMDAADKEDVTITLNAGCNSNPFALGHVLALSVASVTDGSGDPATEIRCTTDGGTLSGLIKASMAVWGITRDVLTMNDLGTTDTPIRSAYGVNAGVIFYQNSFDSTDAQTLWTDVLVPEVIALWNEH